MTSEHDPRGTGLLSNAFFERIAQHAGIALVVLDLGDGDLTLTWVNGAFTRMTGYEADEVVGQSLRTFYQFRWHDVAVEQIVRRVAQGELVEKTLPFRGDHGQDMWLRVSLRDLPADGQSQWICTATDVTEQITQSQSQLASLEFERRTHTDLAALSQVADILGDADHPDVLADVASMLSRTLVGWAGFFLLDDDLRLASGINKSGQAEHSGSVRRRKRAKPGVDLIDDLLASRISGPQLFDLTAQYALGSTSAQIQQEVRQRFLALAEEAEDDPASEQSAGEQSGGEQGGGEQSGDADEVILLALPGSKDSLGLLAATPRREPGNGFSGRDMTILEVVARRVGIAVENVQLYAREHQLAETLQLAMLPQQADIAGLDVWTYYSPNSNHAQVGGDWYDILQINPELAGIVIGDVVGHDVEAAAIMGQLRSVVRSYAYEVGSPAPVLDRVDQLLRGMRIPRAASMVYSTMRSTPSGWLYEYSRAGHLPPLLVRDGQATQLTDGAGSLLGFGVRARTSGQIELRPGDALVLYTDGLIERRDRALRAGLETLMRVASRIRVSDAAGIGEELIANLGEAPEDDVAVVVVRIPFPPGHEQVDERNPRTRRWTLPSEPESIGRARHVVLRTCQAWKLNNVGNAELVVSELLANAVLHGWGHVMLRLFDTDDGLRIEVEDANPAPPVASEGHGTGLGGYGIQIVGRLADWGWRPANTGKIVWAKLRDVRDASSE